MFFSVEKLSGNEVFNCKGAVCFGFNIALQYIVSVISRCVGEDMEETRAYQSVSIP